MKRSYYLNYTFIEQDHPLLAGLHLHKNENMESCTHKHEQNKTYQYIKDCEAGAGRTPSVRRRK